MTKIFKNGASGTGSYTLAHAFNHSSSECMPPQTPRRRVRLRSIRRPGSTEKPPGCVCGFEKQLEGAGEVVARFCHDDRVEGDPGRFRSTVRCLPDVL